MEHQALDVATFRMLERLKAEGRPAVVHGRTIRWTGASGDQNEVSVHLCETAEEATSRALNMARKQGWTQPKWWQWWRWNDTRVAL